MKRGVATGFFTVSLMILFLMAWTFPSAFAHLGTPIDSGWASTPPQIDGSIASGEWTNATILDLTLNMTSRTSGVLNRTLEGRLYVENNWTYAFLAVQVFNDDYEAKDAGGKFDGLFVLFDDNHTGSLVLGDNGEGMQAWNLSPFYSNNDLYYDGAGSWYPDTSDGRNNDGAMAWSHTNPIQGAIGNWTFEMMIPLVGSDDYDFNITSLPKTVGFKIWFQEPFKGFDGVYPDDPTIVKSIDEVTDAATFGNLTFYPLYNLTMVAGTGGATNPPPPMHQYPYKTVVSAMATPDPLYEFDHWELDSANVGAANPYSVTMDQNHTLKAVFVKQLSVSISPTYATFNLGGSVTFNSVVSGGTPAYSYQWYLGSSKVPGAVSASWTFTPSAVGTYYVYLNVTDLGGRVAVSNTAEVVVTPRPVGGYSVSFAKTPSSPPLAYYATALVAFGAVISIIRRKRTGSPKSSRQ